MNARALWIRLHREGFAVRPGSQPGTLSVTPRKSLGPELEALVVRYKPDLLQLAELSHPIPIDRDRSLSVDLPVGERAYRWTPLPSDILTTWARVLTHGELKIVLHLCHASYGPDRTLQTCWSPPELEERLGMSRRAIYDAVGGLLSYGLISRESGTDLEGRLVVRVRLASAALQAASLAT